MKPQAKTERYRTPPRGAFRRLGLGQLVDGHVKVVAGFQFRWWDPAGGITPLIVNARVIRQKETQEVAS